MEMIALFIIMIACTVIAGIIGWELGKQKVRKDLRNEEVEAFWKIRRLREEI